MELIMEKFDYKTLEKVETVVFREKTLKGLNILMITPSARDETKLIIGVHK